MLVVGIDFSSFAIDVVRIHVDDLTPPEWHHWDLVGKNSFDRTRTVADAMPGRSSSFWDDVLAVGIEEPAGKQTGHGFRVQGAVLSMIPPAVSLQKWMPSEWRKAVGAKGNTDKEQVWQHAWELLGGDAMHEAHPMRVHPDRDWGKSPLWPYDAADAYCIARATRSAALAKAAA